VNLRVRPFLYVWPPPETHRRRAESSLRRAAARPRRPLPCRHLPAHIRAAAATPTQSSPQAVPPLPPLSSSTAPSFSLLSAFIAGHQHSPDYPAPVARSLSCCDGGWIALGEATIGRQHAEHPAQSSEGSETLTRYPSLIWRTSTTLYIAFESQMRTASGMSRQNRGTGDRLSGALMKESSLTVACFSRPPSQARAPREPFCHPVHRGTSLYLAYGVGELTPAPRPHCRRRRCRGGTRQHQQGRRGRRR